MAEVAGHCATGWARPGLARSRRRRPRRGHPVGGVPAFFDEGPELVDLDLSERQVADHRGTYSRSVLAGQCEPVQDAIGRVVGEACRRPEAVPLAQERQGLQDRGTPAADGLEEGVLIDAGGSPTCRAAIAPLDMAERLEVARSDLAVVGAVRVVTPAVREFHDVSPPARDDTTIGRSRPTDTLDGFHGIRIQHRKSGLLPYPSSKVIQSKWRPWPMAWSYSSRAIRHLGR